MNELPEGWVVKKLGEVCETTSGGTPSRKNPGFYNGTIPWVKSGELDKGLITDTEEKITEAAVENSSAKIFPKGTLLIALYGATIGKLAFLGVDAATNQAVCGIFESKKVDSKYLYQFLFFKKGDLVKQGIGGAQPNISQGILKNLAIPLPPLPVQQAIVAKIEEVFSELDKGVQQLETARQQLKVYRQSVLKWAFEGRLTNENVVDGELPEGWKWVKLGEVAETCLGKMLDKQKNIGTMKPYLGNINVRWGRFDLDDLPQMRFEEKENERYGLRKGDLVICEGGEPGRAAIWKEQVSEMKIQKALHRVRFNENVSTEFFYNYLQLIAQVNKLDQYFTGTTIKHLTGQSLKKIEFPLPPLSEQHRIVAEIERRLRVCDALEAVIEKSLRSAAVLRQGVLGRAFSGRLVGA